MAELSAFVPLVAPWAPGAPEVAIENAALQAAIEFCRRTLCLQRTLAAVNTVANQADYVPTQAGEVMNKLLGAWLNERPLDLATLAPFDGIAPPEAVDAPSAIAWVGSMRVRLMPPPAVAGLPLVLRAAMVPAQAATTIDDDLFERHAAAVANGAKAWLLSQPDKTYYRPNDAGAYRTLMDEAIATEKVAVLHDRSRSRVRARINWC